MKHIKSMKNVILLADSKTPAWEFATKIQNHINETKEEDVPLKEISINYFRNKEIDMHIESNIRKKDVYFIHDSNKNPQEWWVELLLIKDLLLSASAESVSFVLPNMLYSRKDRKEKSRVPISSRALANTISPGLKRIITMDLHAAQIQGFYPSSVPLDNLYSFPEVVRRLTQNDLNDFESLVIVSPDAGGAERAKAFLQRLEKTDFGYQKKDFFFALISKTRSQPGEIGKMELVGDVKNKDAIIIDDLIDSGKTLCAAADLLKEKGAKKVFCYATHGLFTCGTESLLEKFDKILVSNTHPQEENKELELIDVSPTFAEAIYRAQKGLSVSRLFS